MIGCFSLSQADCKRVAALARLVSDDTLGQDTEFLRIEIGDVAVRCIASDGKRLGVVVAEEKQGELPLGQAESSPMAVCVPGQGMRLLRAFLAGVGKDGHADVTARVEAPGLGKITWIYRDERMELPCEARPWMDWRKIVPLVRDDMAIMRASTLTDGAMFCDEEIVLSTHDGFIGTEKKTRTTSFCLADRLTVLYSAPFVWSEVMAWPDLGVRSIDEIIERAVEALPGLRAEGLSVKAVGP